MKATRKNLEALVSKKYGNLKVDVFKGISLPYCERGWYVRPFGKTARFIGRNLSESIDQIASEINEENDEENEVASHTFEYEDGEDATYIIFYRASGYGHTDLKWSVDAEWSDGPAGTFDHLPTEDEIKAIHDNYIETMAL